MTLAGGRGGVIGLVCSGWILIQELVKVQGREAEWQSVGRGLACMEVLSSPRRGNAATVTKWTGLISRDSWERMWPVGVYCMVLCQGLFACSCQSSGPMECTHLVPDPGPEAGEP